MLCVTNQILSRSDRFLVAYPVLNNSPLIIVCSCQHVQWTAKTKDIVVDHNSQSSDNWYLCLSSPSVDTSKSDCGGLISCTIFFYVATLDNYVYAILCNKITVSIFAKMSKLHSACLPACARCQYNENDLVNTFRQEKTGHYRTANNKLNMLHFQYRNPPNMT